MSRQFAAEADAVRLLQGKGSNLLLVLLRQPAPARHASLRFVHGRVGTEGEGWGAVPWESIPLGEQGICERCRRSRGEEKVTRGKSQTTSLRCFPI